MHKLLCISSVLAYCTFEAISNPKQIIQWDASRIFIFKCNLELGKLANSLNPPPPPPPREKPRKISFWPGIICLCKSMNVNMVVDSACLENSNLIKPHKPWKFEFMNLPHRILFFQGRPEILHPSPRMDILMELPEYVCLYSGLGQM